jgi:parallel beta-helix repeat protein
MKKILLFFIFISLPLLVQAQLSGTGTLGDPYYGTITSSVIWNAGDYVSGTIYVGTSSNNDLIVGNGGHLQINQGVTLIFTQTESDLRINGTGRVTAQGNSSNKVTFTKASANANWGHISFELMTTTNPSLYPSLFDHCIIEYGKKLVNSNSFETAEGKLGHGGGIHINFSYVTIRNSSFENNYASWGGAIFVNRNVSPSFSNCFVNNNSAVSGGGGFYFWGGSRPIVTNCIVTNNNVESTTDYGGGAFFIGPTTDSVKIINCSLINNTAGFRANEIYFSTSGKARVVNCILWGSNTPYYGAFSGSFVNSAIQGGYPSGSVGCINLNSDNSNLSGPNFTTTDGSDWSIKYISPCRDAGKTPSPAVSTDYNGNPRVLAYDIGAYEVQYSRWKTTASSTDWTAAGNWDGGVPTSSRDVIVPSGATNYPTGSPTQDFTLGANKLMILEQGARVTLDDLTNNGILKLNYTSSGFASMIINSYTKGGGATEEIQLYLTGGYIGDPEDQIGRWHYISSPVTSLSVGTFAPAITLDLARYVESRPTFSLSQGWVAYDGYIYPSGPVTPALAFSTLDAGRGYNFWDNLAANTITFGGTFNTGSVPVALSYSTRTDMSLSGFNLLGNPFSSGLNWNDIINSVYFTYPSNTSKGVYFTRENLQCTYINGVGIPGDVTGIIPPMQGFFTKTYASGNTITLAAASRTHNNIHAAYKGSKSEIPLVRLQLKRNNSVTDETVVRFDEAAKSDLDYDFDALKMFISPTQTQTWTALSGTKYAINGLPFPETFIEIPVVINLTKDSVHTITASQLQGLDNYNITLTDNVTGFTANLRTTPVLTFSGATGTVADRFILKISAITTGVETPLVSNGIFSIYPTADLINIQTNSDDWDGKSGSVRVLDLAGKTISNLQNTEFRKNSLTQVQSPAVKGMYVVEIRSGVKRFVGKVVIR